jgi:hypothetical protein
MKRALVLSLAVVFGLGIAAFAVGELHGEWDTKITIDPTATQIATFLDFETELTVTYSVGGWDFTSYSKITDDGWTKQYFEAGGSFGAFSIGSKLTFNTTTLATTLWSVDTSFVFGSVDITVDFDLVPGYVRLCLGGTATTGLVDITIDVCFGCLTFDAKGNPVVPVGDECCNGCCELNFAGVDITIEFPFCCADVTMTIDIDCDGFKQACFAVDGIDIPNLPWVDIDALLCFTPQTKTLTLSPDFDFGEVGCDFDLYICQVQTGGTGPVSQLMLSDFVIQGISIECEVGGVSFTGISYWGEDLCGDKPTALGSYWEMYKIATTGTGDCCGPFNFDLSIFFEKDAASLFDVAAFEANFSYQFGDNFTFSMGFNYNVSIGLTLWTIGFEVTW